MTNLFIFNPDNDLALANFSPNYTAPHNAVALAEAGALLPFFHCNEGDMVIANPLYQQKLNELRRLFNLRGELFTEPSTHNVNIRPWGWSPALVARLKRLGISSPQLDDTVTIDGIRRLSHRRNTIAINRSLAADGVPVPPLPVEILSIDEIDFDNLSQNPVMMKAPWSSSGRGVLASDAFSARQFRDQMKGMIKRQGSVMIEKKLERVADFAMLFEHNNGSTRYRGLSMFESASTGEYIGNLVAPQSYLVDRLCRYGCSELRLKSVQEATRKALSSMLADKYNGPLGVDMMIYRNADGSTAIAPCIEINLRMTMGFVALNLAENFLADESIGLLKVINSGADSVNDPPSLPVIENYKLKEGGISLSPPQSSFQFYFSAEKRRN